MDDVTERQLSDALICGGCHKQFKFGSFSDFIYHKKSDCDDDGGIARQSVEAISCYTCQKSFDSPWNLIVHAQRAHDLKILAVSAGLQGQSSGDAVMKKDGLNTTDVGIQTGCCAAGNSSWEISSQKLISGTIKKVLVEQQVASCCDNGECGVTVLPGTHERPRKCCSSVVPKKRKRHMETKHQHSITAAGKLKKKAMVRVRDKSPGTPKLTATPPFSQTYSDIVSNNNDNTVSDFPLGFATDAFMDSILAEVDSSSLDCNPSKQIASSIPSSQESLSQGQTPLLPVIDKLSAMTGKGKRFPSSDTTAPALGVPASAVLPSTSYTVPVSSCEINCQVSSVSAMMPLRDSGRQLPVVDKMTSMAGKGKRFPSPDESALLLEEVGSPIHLAASYSDSNTLTATTAQLHSHMPKTPSRVAMKQPYHAGKLAHETGRGKRFTAQREIDPFPAITESAVQLISSYSAPISSTVISSQVLPDETLIPPRELTSLPVSSSSQNNPQIDKSWPVANKSHDRGLLVGNGTKVHQSNDQQLFRIPDKDYPRISLSDSVDFENLLNSQLPSASSAISPVSDKSKTSKYNEVGNSKKRNYPTSKPFKCDSCDNSFNQRIHLKKHLSKHTGIKPFKCNLCDYSTVERSHLKVHLRTHTGEKPYKCNFCDYATAQNSTLKIHIKRHHKNAT